jgi:PAS domain S-box-containing protein
MPLPAPLIDRRRCSPIAWLVLLASLVPTFYVWWWIRRHLAQHNEETLWSWLVLAGGLGISALLFGLVWVQDRHRHAAEQANAALRRRDAEFVTLNAELEQRIAGRTAELTAANAELQRFRAVIEATSDLVAMATFEGNTIYVNQAGLRLLKFPPGTDGSGIRMEDVYPADVNQFFREVAIPQAMHDGLWTGETRMLAQTGEEIPVAFVGLVIKSPAGVPIHLACIAHDISARKESEKKLQAVLSELSAANADLSQFKAVIEATTDFVNITDITGRMIYLNQSARRMAGIPPDAEATQFFIKDFAPPWVMELFEREGFPTAFRDGSWSGEVALRHRDGHEIPVSLVGLVIRADTGQPEYLACVARDITEQRRMTEQLKNTLAEERELNVLKSNFISMVSHEIRTPLALILSSSEILSRYLDRLTPEKQQRHLATIDEAVHRMAALVEDVLMFSRAEAGRLEFKPAPLELNRFCTQLADELASAMNRRCPIQLTLPAPPAQVRVDEALLRHILTNLLTNAVKYSTPGVAVTLDVRHEGSQVLLCVQDHGIGIPDADLKRIFTPFYRSPNAAHITGTGLGLVIVKCCVERHGGSIQIESREGAGTTVTLQLPVYVPGQTETFIRPSPTENSP